MSRGYLLHPGGTPITSDEFDWMQYLHEQVPDKRLLEIPEGRAELTRYDPMLFSLIYCREIIKNDHGEISFADLHLDLCRLARTWHKMPVSKESRNLFVAPRGGGKSSWGFKILVLWVGAHKHVKFAAAFSNSATQAQGHLSGLRKFMDSSDIMRRDYPDFCEPMRRPNGNVVSDSQEMTYRKNKFSFAARGIDSGVLGMVDPDNTRPQLILLDDIEADESNYSAHECRKRLMSVTDTILPMRENAHVLWIGTVTMPDSLTHQAVKSVVNKDERPADWIVDEKFKVNYVRPIIKRPDGTERSFWEGKFPFDRGSRELGGLKYDRNTRSFKKNLENLPMSDEGFWSEEDFRYGRLDECTKTLLQIDPATTSKKTSDFTAFSVISYQPGLKSRQGKDHDRMPMCMVRHVEAVKLPPAELRRKALRLLELFPDIGGIRIEANQGGETWRSVFHNMPVDVVIHHESVPKKVRAEHLLNHYQRGRVYHEKPFPDLEDQMLSFPHVQNDDLIDTVGAGVQYFLRPKAKTRVRSTSYM